MRWNGRQGSGGFLPPTRIQRQSRKAVDPTALQGDPVRAEIAFFENMNGKFRVRQRSPAPCGGEDGNPRKARCQ